MERMGSNMEEINQKMDARIEKIREEMKDVKTNLENRKYCRTKYAGNGKQHFYVVSIF